MWITKLPWDHIRRQAYYHGLDWELVGAICFTESGGDHLAVRFEPGWKYHFHARQYADGLGITGETEEVLQSTSWGLMQVMGTVARELGFREMLTALTDPDLSLKYGCMKLAQLKNRYSTLREVIASYNAGSPVYKKDGGGMLINERYVDKVSHLLRELEYKGL